MLSFRAKILFPSIVAYITLALFSLFLIYKDKEVQKERAFDSYSVAVDSINNIVGGRYIGRYTTIQAIALDSTLQQINNPTQISNLLEKYRKSTQSELILYVDRNGKYIASSTELSDGTKANINLIRGINFSNRDWFKNVVKGNFTEDITNGLIGTYSNDFQIDPLASELYGKDKVTLAFTAAVKDRFGNLIGIVTTRTSAKWLENELKGTFRSLEKSGAHFPEIILVNSKGIIIVDYNIKTFDKDNNYNRNMDVILKQNLLSEKFEPVKHILEGKSGDGEYYFERNKTKMLVSYSPLNSNRFLRSLNWGIITMDPADDVFMKINNIALISYIIISVLLLFSIIIVLKFTASLTKNFNYLTDKLRKSSVQSEETSQNLKKSFTLVAETVQNQTKSINDTNQIMRALTGMISQTTDNANECSNISNVVKSEISEGNMIMEKLAKAVAEIRETNNELMQISEMIDQISTKTNVINEIVSKTELLSLNASIEAARAGEQGKGFAVVAEEVGQLAKTSGKTASEIRTLIESGKKQVNEIISATKNRLEVGQTASDVAQKIFHEISHEINELQSRTENIKEATKEQKIGISQVATAMSQIDKSTEKNTFETQKAVHASEQVHQQSDELFQIMTAIRVLVYGAKLRILNAEVKGK
ncbi:methyl-accepting chemotaxis protein [Fluviispira vulneris]|uniref:methyl-accepting chemotaxis protein n=1 Tax=Fluviispira vulneris TaxID=2763012 RepID=UPI0016495BBD|nr:methyl-accepting chemotaxis protein [Fluviispira vulneris]